MSVRRPRSRYRAPKPQDLALRLFRFRPRSSPIVDRSVERCGRYATKAPSRLESLPDAIDGSAAVARVPRAMTVVGPDSSQSELSAAAATVRCSSNAVRAEWAGPRSARRIARRGRFAELLGGHQAVQGAAPTLSGHNRANPAALQLSAAMLLHRLGIRDSNRALASASNVPPRPSRPPESPPPTWAVSPRPANSPSRSARGCVAADALIRTRAGARVVRTPSHPVGSTAGT